MTGSVRIPFREPRSAARLSRTFSQSLSAMEIAEPLASLDENQPVTLAAEMMHSQCGTVLGVRRAGILIGWETDEDLTSGALSDTARSIGRGQVLDGSTGLGVVRGKFATTEYVFVEWLGQVAGVITRGILGCVATPDEAIAIIRDNRAAWQVAQQPQG